MTREYEGLVSARTSAPVTGRDRQGSLVQGSSQKSSGGALEQKGDGGKGEESQRPKGSEGERTSKTRGGLRVFGRQGRDGP